MLPGARGAARRRRGGSRAGRASRDLRRRRARRRRCARSARRRCAGCSGFAKFSPHLTGGVAAGWATEHSDIRLELVANDAKSSSSRCSTRASPIARWSLTATAPRSCSSSPRAADCACPCGTRRRRGSGRAAIVTATRRSGWTRRPWSRCLAEGVRDDCQARGVRAPTCARGDDVEALTHSPLSQRAASSAK